MKAGVACDVDFSAAAAREGGSRVSVGLMGPLENARESDGVRRSSWAAMAEDSSAGKSVEVGSDGALSVSACESEAETDTSTGGGGGGMVGSIGTGRNTRGVRRCAMYGVRHEIRGSTRRYDPYLVRFLHYAFQPVESPA